MGKIVEQIIETSNDDGRTGTVTVITTDESGKQSASTREYDNAWSSSSKETAIEKATQDSLNK